MLSVNIAARAQSPDDNYNRGVQALSAQDFATAQQAFSTLVQQRPSAANYSYLAMAQVGGGSLKPAIASFRKVIALGGDSANLRYNLGLACLDDQQPKEAILQFQKSLALDPKYTSARNALGVALLNNGQPAKAIPYLEDVRKTTPRDPAVWVNLVNALFATGNEKAATGSAEKAVQAIPDDARLPVTLAASCLRHGQAQAARNLLEDANELMPNDDDVRLLLAKASIIGGEPVEALAVLKADPQDKERLGEQLVLRGQAKALTGDTKGAGADFLGALQHSPDNVEYLTTYAWFQQLQAHHTDALATLEHARAIAPASAEVAYRMAVSYYFSDQSEKAKDLCGEALRLSPAYTPAYLLRGTINLKQKTYSEAEHDFRKAVELNAAEAMFHRQLGEALLDEQNTADARRQLELALKLDPKDAEAYSLRARLEAQQGATEQAIADLKLALQIRPGAASAASQLAEVYRSTGKTDLAEAVLAQQRNSSSNSLRQDQDDPLLTRLPVANQ